MCKRIKKDLANPPVISSRSLVLKQLLNDLSILATSDGQQQLDGVDETDEPHTSEVDSPDSSHTNRQSSVDSPARHRQLSHEEDDESYIQRIKTEMRKSGRRIPSKQSIMKHPKEHPKVRKQVSFQAGDEDDALTPKGSPARSLTSPKHKKLSKRSKLRIFKRQSSTEQEEKENIIPNEGVNGDDTQHISESDEESGGEQPDNAQGGSIVRVEHDINKEAQSIAQGSPIPAAIKRLSEQSSNNRLSVSGDEADELASRSLSLSRSPGVRRRHEAAIRISGMSFDDAKESTIIKSRPTSAKSINTPHWDGNTASTPALNISSSPSTSPSTVSPENERVTSLASTNLSPIDSAEKINAENTLVEGDADQPSVFKRVPLVKHQRQFVFDRTAAYQGSTTIPHNTYETADEKDSELPTSSSFDQEAFLVSPTTADRSELKLSLSPKKSLTSPLRSPRLPKLPRFDETRFVEMKRKISEDGYNED